MNSKPEKMCFVLFFRKRHTMRLAILLSNIMYLKIIKFSKFIKKRTISSQVKKTYTNIILIYIDFRT